MEQDRIRKIRKFHFRIVAILTYSADNGLICTGAFSVAGRANKALSPVSGVAGVIAIGANSGFYRFIGTAAVSATHRTDKTVTAFAFLCV